MSDPIKDLRELNVFVAHPGGQSADELLQQVKRIGCNVDQCWPLPKLLSEKYNLVFLDVTDQSAERLKSFIRGSSTVPSVVAVVGYENPSVLDLIFEIGAHSVINKPIRASGVLSCMLMARRFQQEQSRCVKELKKLREKLENVQKVNDAKFILMRHHGISEREAYNLIRKQAMAKRTTTAEISLSIINAQSVLSDMGDT